MFVQKKDLDMNVSNKNKKRKISEPAKTKIGCRATMCIKKMVKGE